MKFVGWRCEFHGAGQVSATLLGVLVMMRPTGMISTSRARLVSGNAEDGLQILNVPVCELPFINLARPSAAKDT
ncbi:hypothetical protein D9M68_916380 [compost metagenome]